MSRLRSLLWALAKWFLFRLDAETAHRATLVFVQLGIRLGGAPLRIASGAPRAVEGQRHRILGLEFASRVGLAAGFDKDAEILRGLPNLGFGFAEIGTVTPRPQPGNDRPRLFRDPERRSLFNRMGFNGLGAEVVSSNLRESRPRLPSWFRVGVNLGKNKDTPLERAAEDYARAATAFEGLADYLVINVSSPNTPGLRSLQAAESIRPIIGSVGEAISRWRSRPPLLLKLSPEVRGEALEAIIEAAEASGIEGWVLTNTLAGEWDRVEAAPPLAGGWSGGALSEGARKSLLEVRGLTRKPIISVGGILTPEEARWRIQAGADLVQLYSGWIYGGPGFPFEVARALL